MFAFLRRPASAADHPDDWVTRAFETFMVEAPSPTAPQLDEQDFADLVRTRLAEMGATPFGLAKANGLPDDAIRNVIRTDSKRTEPTLPRARQICAALGLELIIRPKTPEASR